MVKEKENVCCGGMNTLVLACSGTSNVGQVSNSIMVELDKKGIANGYCLAGLGAEISGFVESAKTAQTVLIDGCPIGCGRKVFEKCGIQPTKYFIITEFGVEKRHAFDKLSEEANHAMDCIVSSL